MIDFKQIFHDWQTLPKNSVLLVFRDGRTKEQLLSQIFQEQPLLVLFPPKNPTWVCDRILERCAENDCPEKGKWVGFWQADFPGKTHIDDREAVEYCLRIDDFCEEIRELVEMFDRRKLKMDDEKSSMKTSIAMSRLVKAVKRKFK